MGVFPRGLCPEWNLFFISLTFWQQRLTAIWKKIIYTFNYFFLFFFIFLNIWQLICTINAEVMKILFIFFYFLFGSFIFSCMYLFLFTIQHFYLLHLFLFIFSRIFSQDFTELHLHTFFYDTPRTPYNNAWNKRRTAFLVLLDQFW